MKLKGKDINIMLDGTIVAVAKSCDIDMQCDTTEVSSLSTGKWKTYIAGRNGWTVTISRYVQAVEDDLLLLGKTVTLIVTKTENGEPTGKMQGSAIVTQCTTSASVGTMASGSMQLLGSGELAAISPSE